MCRLGIRSASKSPKFPSSAALRNLPCTGGTALFSGQGTEKVPDRLWGRDEGTGAKELTFLTCGMDTGVRKFRKHKAVLTLRRTS